MQCVEKTAPLKKITDLSPFMRVCILLAAGVLATLSVIHPIFAVLAFVLCAAYVLFAKPQDVFLFLFFLLPFAYIFKLSAGSSSLFTYLQLVVVARFVLTQRRWNAPFTVAFLLFFGFLFAGSFFKITVLLKQALMPLLIYFFFLYPPKLKHVTLHYTAAMTITSIVALFKDLIPNMSMFLKYDPIYELGNDTVRFAGFNTDPNYYSFALILCLVGILVLYTHKEIGGLIAFPVLVVFAYFGAQTASKSFILMLLAVFILFFVDLLRNKKYKTSLVFLAATALAIVYVLRSDTSVFQNVIDRFLLSDGDVTTNRSNIWDRYLAYFGEAPLKLFFGSGIGADYYRGTAAHNTYIDLLYYYGIFGIALFFAVLTVLYRMIPRSKKRISNFLPLLCALVMLFFLSALMYHDFAYTIIFVLYFLTADLTPPKRITP